MINPATFLRLSKAKEEFKLNHPKFPLFLKAVQEKAVEEGSVVEISVTRPTGECLTSNIKLKGTDVSFIQDLCELLDEKKN